jgi:hypothetical protein
MAFFVWFLNGINCGFTVPGRKSRSLLRSEGDNLKVLEKEARREITYKRRGVIIIQYFYENFASSASCEEQSGQKEILKHSCEAERDLYRRKKRAANRVICVILFLL